MKNKYVQIENKNAILELLQEGKIFTRIFMARNAFKDPKTDLIVKIAREKKIPIEVVARKILSRRSRTTSNESIIGLIESSNNYNLKGLINDLYNKGEDPYFLIFDNVKYAQNIATIFRTGFAAFVNGIITPVKKENLITDEIIRISMGTSERIPIVEMNLFSAIKECKEEAIKVLALDMDGKTYFDYNLTGPIAFVLGSEDVGISTRILEKVDDIISIPMKEGIGSLNVSSSASIIMYEKIRQEAVKARKSNS